MKYATRKVEYCSIDSCRDTWIFDENGNRLATYERESLADADRLKRKREENGIIRPLTTVAKTPMPLKLDTDNSVGC